MMSRTTARGEARASAFPRTLRALAAATGLLLAGTAAQAAWNEATDGDLSNDGLAPSFLALTAGSNLLTGTTGRTGAGGPVDRDYLHISVPAGHVLQGLWVQPGTTSLGSGAFLGLMSGSQFTIPSDTATAAGMLGWTIFGADQIGSDLFDVMSAPSFESIGFSVPLPAGEYSLWIQELAVGTANYGLDFVVAEVPEAPSALAMLGGLALLGAVLRRR
jgi:hypothetical protein